MIRRPGSLDGDRTILDGKKVEQTNVMMKNVRFVNSVLVSCDAREQDEQWVKRNTKYLAHNQ